MTTPVRYGDIADTFGSGGSNVAPGGSAGSPSMRDAHRASLGAHGAPYANSTELTASKAADRVDGQVVVKLDDYTKWTWKAADATAADSTHIAPTDVGVGAGRWVREDAIESDTDLALASTTPAAIGTSATATQGVGTTAARADHVHANLNSDPPGANLTDTASQTIQVSQGRWRQCGTLSQDSTVTLSTTGAIDGDKIDITRFDATSAHTLTIVDGGSGTPTLCVFPNSKKASAQFQFSSGHWLLRQVGTL